MDHKSCISTLCSTGALDGIDTDSHVTVCLSVTFWFIAADGSCSVISNMSPEVMQTKVMSAIVQWTAMGGYSHGKGLNHKYLMV
jgi:hypothetical protein